MYNYFHTTKKNNLINILQEGLQPFYSENSLLIADRRTGKVSYSAGLQATVDMFNIFRRYYYKIKEGGINENSFRQSLSPEVYAMHQKSINKILETESFEDWIKDNIYLCFDENCISDKHEEKPEDAYTSEPISPDQLKVCVIKSKANDSIVSSSMKDVYCFLYAKNPELKKGLGTWEYEEDIEKYKNDDYYMDYLSIEKFIELYQIKPQTALKNALQSGTTLARTRKTDNYTQGRGDHNER